MRRLSTSDNLARLDEMTSDYYSDIFGQPYEQLSSLVDLAELFEESCSPIYFEGSPYITCNPDLDIHGDKAGLDHLEDFPDSHLKNKIREALKIIDNPSTRLVDTLMKIDFLEFDIDTVIKEILHYYMFDQPLAIYHFFQGSDRMRIYHILQDFAKPNDVICQKISQISNISNISNLDLAKMLTDLGCQPLA